MAEKMTDQSDNVLEEANKLIYGDRNKDYGHPRDNMQAIATLWNNYLAAKPDNFKHITPKDVTMFMILVKVAREAHLPKRDNLVDIAGYAGVADRLSEDIPVKQGDGLLGGIEIPAKYCSQCDRIYHNIKLAEKEEFINCPKCMRTLEDYIKPTHGQTSKIRFNGTVYGT